MISFAIVGDPNRIPDRIANMIPAIQRRSLEAMQRCIIELTALTKTKLSDQILHVRTGTLRRSIHGSVSSTNTQVVGTVGTNVIYARINEFGGKTPPHVIAPKNAKALAWLGTGALPQNLSGGGIWKKSGGWTKRGGVKLGEAGNLQFAKIVHHPGSKIPERSYLRTSLKELEPSILARFRQATTEVISQ